MRFTIETEGAVDPVDVGIVESIYTTSNSRVVAVLTPLRTWRVYVRGVMAELTTSEGSEGEDLTYAVRLNHGSYGWCYVGTEIPSSLYAGRIFESAAGAIVTLWTDFA